MRSRSQLSTLAVVALAAMLGGAPASAGTLDAAPEATWSGDFGLALGLGDTDPAYVETDTPDDEGRYVVRFYFNADALTLGPSGSLVLFRGLSDAPVPIVTVLLRSDARLRARAGLHCQDRRRRNFYRRRFGRIGMAPPRARLGRGDPPPAPTTGISTSPRRRAHGRPGPPRQRPVDGQLRALGGRSGGRRSHWNDVARRLRVASRRPIGPILAGSLDLDGNGALEALTDGLLFLHVLRSASPASL